MKTKSTAICGAVECKEKTASWLLDHADPLDMKEAITPLTHSDMFTLKLWRFMRSDVLQQHTDTYSSVCWIHIFF